MMQNLQAVGRQSNRRAASAIYLPEPAAVGVENGAAFRTERNSVTVQLRSSHAAVHLLQITSR